MERRTPRAPRLMVHVTEEQIKEAMPRDSGHCMIAEAVKAAFPDARTVAVDIQTIRFSDPRRGLRYTYLTPRIGQIGIIQFDQGVQPEPFTMSLRNGQVTASGSNSSHRKPEERNAKKAAAGKKGADVKAKNAALVGASARLVDRNRTGSVPDRVGGKTPPMAPGRRRAFGLRALEH